MGEFFCDSSAIVKRYVTEAGSEYVDGLTDPNNGNAILLARITQVEVAAAITRRSRSGNTTLADADNAIAAFQYDLINTYYRIEITPAVLDSAMFLARKHGLRGYDAVQLAAVLDANTESQNAGLPAVTLVSSDDELNLAAAAEGIKIEDPNEYS